MVPKGRKAAEAGHADAQCALGLMYSTIDGVELDHVEAAKWFRKAAEAGHVDTHRKAAEAGNADAQWILGHIMMSLYIDSYINDDGVAVHLSEPAKWMQLAAVQGHDIALTGLEGMQQLNLIPTPPPAPPSPQSCSPVPTHASTTERPAE